MKPSPRKKLRRRAWLAAFLVVLSFGIGCGSPTGIAIDALKFVGESDGTVNVDVTLDKVYTDTVTVQYATQTGTATAGTDFDSTSGTLVFPPGETKQTITVNILNDAIGESDEVFYLSISNAENANLKAGAQTCDITIIDDDNSPPTVQFDSATATVSEGAGTATLTVSLSALAPTAVTVNYATANGTGADGAVAGADYTSTSGTLTFALGETTKSIIIPILDDATVEPNETFSVELSDPSTGVTLGSQKIATVTINDNDTLTVTATSGSPSPSAILVDKQTIAKLTASANIESSSQNPSWTWTYTVEYAATPGDYGDPPLDATYSITIDAPPTTSPSATDLTASFSKAGYWRITNLKAAADYAGKYGSTYANDVEVVVAKVELAPATSYLQIGGTSIVTATVTPTGASSAFTYSSRDVGVATVVGDPAFPTAVGVAVGATKIDAKLGSDVAATVDVKVFDVTYSPQSGPVYSKVTFTINTPGVTFFSADTTIRIDAVFSPTEFDEEFFTVTHSGSKVLFDSMNPNQISLAVADVFPESFLTSENPGVTGSLMGSVSGLVTLTDGDKQVTVNATFEITSAGTIGTLVCGVFQEQTDAIAIWQVTSAADLVDRDPSCFQYAQIIRPANEFTTSPPSTITAQIKSVRADGTDVSAGISVEFTLVSSGTFHVYQSTKAFLFIDDPTYEGESSDLIAIAGEEDASVVMVRLPQ